MAITILLLDDETEILELYSQILQKASPDYKCLSYDKPNEAVKLLKEDGVTPDLFIIDYHMPELDGIQFVQQVNELKIERPVILATGYADKDVAIQALNLGVFGLIEKPIHSSQLKMAAKRALDYYKAIQMVSRLIGLQRSIIEDIEIIKEDYEERLNQLEGKVLESGENISEKERESILNRARIDRISNRLLDKMKQELGEISSNFEKAKIWR